MPRQALTALALLVSCIAAAYPDKVILKDGKIYEGRVMGETTRSILISQPNQPPRFIPLNEVMTIVREKNPEIPNPDRDRFIHMELGLTGNFFSSGQMDTSPGAGIALLGGFRLHPLIQVEGGLDWVPAFSGELAVTDGTNFRRYERFQTWNGGFGLRLFPLALLWKSNWEPYIVGGWRWNRLLFKGSGDDAKGDSWNVGLGVSKALGQRLFWENRLAYQHASFDKIRFLSREGRFSDPMGLRVWILTTGLSFHL